MANQEKQAWIGLIIILVTLAAYFALFSYRGKFDSTSLAVFAIAGFLGFRRTRRRSGEIVFDERDRQIQRQALLVSMCIFYISMIIFSVVAGITNGWDASVPIWVVVQVFWAALLVVWAIKFLIVIMQYRRGAHA
jgi:uncharacterized membrane protein